MEGKLLFGFACVGIPDYRGLCSANRNEKLAAVPLAKYSPESGILTRKDGGGSSASKPSPSNRDRAGRHGRILAAVPLRCGQNITVATWKLPCKEEGALSCVDRRKSSEQMLRVVSISETWFSTFRVSSRPVNVLCVFVWWSHLNYTLTNEFGTADDTSNLLCFNAISYLHQ